MPLLKNRSSLGLTRTFCECFYLNEMMITKALFVSAFLFISHPAIVVSGQGRPEWIGQVKEALKREEPLWKIGEGLVNDSGASYGESFRLTKGAQTGAVQIVVYYILTNPEETFSGLVTATDNINGKRQTKTKHDGIGTEAYMWAGSNAGGYATLIFKKDRTFVTVFLPGKATAQRVAKLVASQIPGI
jgi:hypothetical protein